MGQARLRGSKEQRVVEGILKAEEQRQKVIQSRINKEAALTPEQRARRSRVNSLLSTLVSVAVGSYTSRYIAR